MADARKLGSAGVEGIADKAELDNEDKESADASRWCHPNCDEFGHLQRGWTWRGRSDAFESSGFLCIRRVEFEGMLALYGFVLVALRRADCMFPWP